MAKSWRAIAKSINDFTPDDGWLGRPDKLEVDLSYGGGGWTTDLTFADLKRLAIAAETMGELLEERPARREKPRRR